LASQQGFADLDQLFDEKTLREKLTTLDQKDREILEQTMESTKKLKWKYPGFVHQYLDDSLIASMCAQQMTDEKGNKVPGHKEHLLQFLRVCSLENIPIQPSKSHVFCKYLRFLGVIVGRGRLLCDPVKIKSVIHMSAPSSQKELRSFLGAVGWFRLWIDNFAETAACLNPQGSQRKDGRKQEIQT